jgi:hypothetical protein
MPSLDRCGADLSWQLACGLMNTHSWVAVWDKSQKSRRRSVSDGYLATLCPSTDRRGARAARCRYTRRYLWWSESGAGPGPVFTCLASLAVVTDGDDRCESRRERALSYTSIWYNKDLAPSQEVHYSIAKAVRATKIILGVFPLPASAIT